MSNVSSFSYHSLLFVEVVYESFQNKIKIIIDELSSKPKWLTWMRNLWRGFDFYSRAMLFDFSFTAPSWRNRSADPYLRDFLLMFRQVDHSFYYFAGVSFGTA